MAIFLDTGNFKEIKNYFEMGIIRGVTTNPSIMSKEKDINSFSSMKQKCIEIAKLIDPLPLSIEVLSNDRDEMIKQSIDFSSWATNINVKITIHGPNGELENLKVINYLSKEKKIKINVTAMMSAQQCLLSAFAGAEYVSIFGGRVNNMGYDSIIEIKKLRNVLDSLNLNSKIIVGSTREVINIFDWINAGAHIVTSTPHLLNSMIIHPYTKETVKMFMDDAKKINFE